jgi:hypothetical protein
MRFFHNFQIATKVYFYLAGLVSRWATRMHLDDVESLGQFMELEVVLRDGQSDDEGQAIAEELMTRLGVRKEDLLEGAYMDLLEKRGRIRKPRVKVTDAINRRVPEIMVHHLYHEHKQGQANARPCFFWWAKGLKSLPKIRVEDELQDGYAPGYLRPVLKAL